MTTTHLILTRSNGERVELTIDEARALWHELGRALGLPPTTFVVQPLPSVPHYVPQDWWHTQPGAADPWFKPYVITCEARQ